MNSEPFEWIEPASRSALARDVDARLDEAMASGRLPPLHCLLVARDGRLLFERYWAGTDENWGRPLGEVRFGPATLHDLRSVTKSIVGLLYGIALDRGQVPPPAAKLMASFPEYPDLAADRERDEITIAHVLTMTMGTEWDESLPYTDPANSEIAMELAADRYRFVLERPIIAEPGTRWTYSGGATALLGELISRGTRRALRAFAQESLFAPLGIGDFEWAPGFEGATPSAASGLRLRPRDLARIGLLVLQHGRWRGRSVVPSSWLDVSLTPHATIAEPAQRYGFHWYLGEWPYESPAGPRTDRRIWAYGNGGQRLVLFPDLDVVVVTTSGNYNQPAQLEPMLSLLREIVLRTARDDE